MQLFNENIYDTFKSDKNNKIIIKELIIKIFQMSNQIEQKMWRYKSNNFLESEAYTLEDKTHNLILRILDQIGDTSMTFYLEKFENKDFMINLPSKYRNMHSFDQLIIVHDEILNKYKIITDSYDEFIDLLKTNKCVKKYVNETDWLQYKMINTSIKDIEINSDNITNESVNELQLYYLILCNMDRFIWN